MKRIREQHRTGYKNLETRILRPTQQPSFLRLLREPRRILCHKGCLIKDPENIGNVSSGSGNIVLSTVYLYTGNVFPFTVTVPTGCTCSNPSSPETLSAALASHADSWMSHDMTTGTWCFLDVTVTEMTQVSWLPVAGCVKTESLLT